MIQIREKLQAIGAIPGTVWRFYRDGFRSMTTGRYLWAMILLKIALLLFVFRLLLPDRLRQDYDTDSERARAVRSTLISPRQ